VNEASRAAGSGNVGYDAPIYGSNGPVVATSFDKLASLYNQDVAAQAQSLVAPGVGFAPKLVRPDSFDLVGCSHNRAVLVFADAILNDTCHMTGYQCDSYDLFLESEGGCGQCENGTTCSRMGLYSNPALAEKNRIKRFYTVTRALSPYCSNFKVQFTLQTASPSQPDNKERDGSIYISIQGTTGKISKVLVSKPEFIDLVPGRSYSFYPEITKDLGNLQSITLNWKPKSKLGFLAPAEYIYLEGDIFATDKDGVVNVFTPPKSKVQSTQDLTAKFVRQQDERR